ncbi:MAG: carbohydrate-binding protein [Verrucomicrobiota bacterium]|nr:carbohydrate-binding protein [Verrucomicrobiota bacterium]
MKTRPDASNGHGLGWTRKGEWLNYTVEVKKSGIYTIEMPVASKKMGGFFVLEIKGKALCKPINIPDTGGWDKLKLIKCTDVKLDSGRHVIRVVMLDQGPSGSIGDIDYFKFVKKSK